MKRMLSIVTMLLLAGSASAQLDPDLDGVNTYFDTAGTSVCLDFTGGPVSVYLVLTNQSVITGVGGFECHVDYAVPAGNFEQSWTLPLTAINVSTAPDFIVGFGNALPHGNAIVLATYGVLVFGAECMTFNVRASDSGNLIYADGINPGLLIPMQVSSDGSPYGAGLNCPGCVDIIIDTDNQTWGQMKTLYR
ncbi:MAG: hypothetical protein ABIF77_21125 [bacterium]